MKKHEVYKVQKKSIGAQMGVAPGDYLQTINGQEVRDVLDYRFRIAEENLMVEIEKPNGEVWELDIEKDIDEDLGLEFKQSLMSPGWRCGNKCVFCFVDQQPKGLRQTLYVKDDDARLSFLLGNYVTLTNLSDAEISRLASYRLSPLRISVHAADLDVRAKMMGTNRARNLFKAIEVFNNAGIEMHFQIVLCKGLNDGDVLSHTIGKLKEVTPGGKSLAIVPAGLTRHREGLFPLQQFTQQEAAEVIKQVEGDFGNSPKPQGLQVYLSDEWYILAGKPLPSYKYYGNFPQLDNGVGVMRLFQRKFLYAKKRHMEILRARANYVPIRPGATSNVTIVTGTAASNFMKTIAATFTKTHQGLNITVRPIENQFFGTTVTVSGLLTGQDIVKGLKNNHASNIIIVPENAFRAGVKEKVMIDGTTLKDLEAELGATIVVGSTDGFQFYKQLAELNRAKM